MKLEAVPPLEPPPPVKLPKSVALPVDAIVIKSIVSLFAGLALPPKNTLRVRSAPDPPCCLLETVKLPKSVALPVQDTFINSISS